MCPRLYLRGRWRPAGLLLLSPVIVGRLGLDVNVNGGPDLVEHPDNARRGLQTEPTAISLLLATRLFYS